GDGTETGKVQLLRVSREARDDHFRLVLDSQGFDFVVIDQTGLRVQAILNRVVDLAGEVHAGTVGQVATVSKTHTQNGITGLEQRHEYRRVGLGTGMRLHVGVGRTKQLLGAGNGQIFSDVDKLAATVVTLAGVSFGVLVGQS